MSTSQHNSDPSSSMNDAPCVWMAAGVLAYQLCNREFDCDACPLDIALKKHFSRDTLESTPVMKPAASGKVERLRRDCMYSENHCWVQKRGEETFRVGIEPHLAHVLLIPKSVVLPSLGQEVKQNQSSVWIVLEQGTFPVTSPLDGEVVSRNTLIAEQPSNVLQHSFDSGWLYELNCKANAEKSLMNASRAEVVFEEHLKKLNSTLMQALKPGTTEIGPTLADGGVLLQHIADMLGYKKYIRIVKSVFG